MLIPNPKQAQFCKLFASDREFFGNGVQSYMRAYNLTFTKKNYTIAKTGAYQLLQRPHITKRINKLFEAGGLNDTFVDKQLSKLLVQDADFRTKLGAIKEYNALKARIKNQHELVPINITITRGNGDSKRDGSVSATDNSLAQEDIK